MRLTCQNETVPPLSAAYQHGFGLSAGNGCNSRVASTKPLRWLDRSRRRSGNAADLKGRNHKTAARARSPLQLDLTAINCFTNLADMPLAMGRPGRPIHEKPCQLRGTDTQS